MSARTLARPAARWRRTLTDHKAVNGRCPICRTRGPRCWEWAEAFGQLVAHDLLLPPGQPSPTTGRTRRPADPTGDTVHQLNFVRPTRCDNSGPNCVEVAIDADLNRVVRNSQRPQEQVVFDAEEWSAFVDSVRAGQPF